MCFVDEWSTVCYGVIGSMLVFIMVIVTVAVLIWYRLWAMHRAPRVLRHSSTISRNGKYITLYELDVDVSMILWARNPVRGLMVFFVQTDHAEQFCKYSF